MIKILHGNDTAVLVGRTWSSNDQMLTQMLQLAADEVFIHGGHPSPEDEIVNDAIKRFGVKVVDRSDAEAEDIEADIEADSTSEDDLIY